MGSSPRSYLFTSATGRIGQCSRCTIVRHKPYPICDDPLSTSARHSFAPSKKSRRHSRSCVSTEALPGMIFVAAQKLSGSVNISLSEGYNGTPLSSTEAPAAYSNENKINWKNSKGGIRLCSHRRLRAFSSLFPTSLRWLRHKEACAEERNGTPLVLAVTGK